MEEKVIELGGACAVVVLEELDIDVDVLELDVAISKKKKLLAKPLSYFSFLIIILETCCR